VAPVPSQEFILSVAEGIRTSFAIKTSFLRALRVLRGEFSFTANSKVSFSACLIQTAQTKNGAMGIAISGAIMTYALGANGLTPGQIESPES
jgi:hypothetical protein